MNDLLYISHPQLNKIDSKIIKTKNEGKNTKIILDRSIFMPTSPYLLDENPRISGNEVSHIRFINGNLIHTVNNKIKSSSVKLSFDKDIRLKNMDYNTAFFIFKSLFLKYYNKKDLTLKIKDNYSQIKVSNFHEDFSIDDFLSLFNKLIDLGLKINKDRDFVEIKGFDKDFNSGVYHNNTKYLQGIFVFSVEKIDETLLIDFITGADYKNFTKNNIKVISEIKKISFSEIDTSDKLRKIISTIQKSTYI
ncbi:hypothetical protein ANHYDRO_01658 [Anaerococcus hydrogenalis DSM 7454]|uniref:Uncharacterized protein n=1 Tax=Anaerococcus hydrogenalis DSM 7454 TaxID=561177 RepID=B6WAX5_9FIRM|nr:hypothetical protein [Anaerococcus hydrogenalis]EEB35475.1 hypothetical protein ANHYDRO_01658 [Anaerococcus hydrogenalis DSM 7454]